MRWHRMNYGLEKPKLSFLKGLGLRRLCEKVSGLISSNPKRIKCIFIGHPKQLGIPPNSDPKAIWIVSRIGSFLEEKFLSKELSGRMVETWWGYWTIHYKKNALPWWYVFVTVGRVFCHACTSMTNLWQNQDSHTRAVVEVFHDITKIIIMEVSTSMTINRASQKCFRQGWPTRGIHRNGTLLSYRVGFWIR